MGDSYVEALQVESDRNFLAIAERQLNKENGFEIEIMNFGRSGFTQTEELLVLKNEVIYYAPDMLILFFTPENDIDDVRRETTPGQMRPFFNDLGNGDLQLDTSFAAMPGFKSQSVNRLVQTQFCITVLNNGAI